MDPATKLSMLSCLLLSISSAGAQSTMVPPSTTVSFSTTESSPPPTESSLTTASTSSEITPARSSSTTTPLSMAQPSPTATSSIIVKTSTMDTSQTKPPIITMSSEFALPTTMNPLTTTLLSATTTESSSVSSIESQTTTSSTDLPVSSVEDETTVSTTTDTIQVDITTIMVLWIVLGCLVALIIITLGAIFLVSTAHYRRYKRKKQPTALDIISKWEDTPNESSDIQLLSMKTIGEGEDKDGKEQNNDGTKEKEAGKEGSDEKVETKEVNKEDDVTVGTFGFAENSKAAEPTGSNAENRNTTTVTESEEDDQNKKDVAAKVDRNEKFVEVTIEKAGEDCATNTGSGENPAPDGKSVTGINTTIPTEKEKVQEGTKLEPVPVQIPLLGKQVDDEKAPESEHAAEVKTAKQSDKPTSPSKDKAVKPETSSSNSKDVPATESVSKEPESAATITKPQTEDVKTDSLASDKPPDGATGGFSLFTNEDMEKALGVAATIDLGQVESTQL